MSETNRIRRIGLNALSVFGGDGINRAGIFVVYASLSRFTGAHEFGQLSLGLLLLYTFHVFAAAGLPTLLVRAVARRPRAAMFYLKQGYLACLIPAVLGCLSMTSFAIVMQYERQTVLVIGILSVAIIPYAFTMIAEAVVKGREKMHLVLFSNIPGNVVLVGGSIVVLINGWSVSALATVIVASKLVTWLCIDWLTRASLIDCRSAGPARPRLAYSLLKQSLIFLGVDGVHAVWAALNAIILSKFATERELGLLASCFQLTQPMLMVYRSVGHSSFPALVSAARQGREAVGHLSQTVIGFMLLLAFPATLAMFMLAPDLLRLVYGNVEFVAATMVLQIVAIRLLLDPLNPILGHGLWAVGKDATVFRIVIVNTLVNGTVGVLLISQFGLLGAAYSSLAGSALNAMLHVLYFNRYVQRLDLASELLRIGPPILVALAVVLWLPANLYVKLAVGLSAYAIVGFICTGRTLMHQVVECKARV